MIVVYFLAAFYGFISLYACLHVAGLWIAGKLDAWQARQLSKP